LRKSISEKMENAAECRYAIGFVAQEKCDLLFEQTLVVHVRSEIG